eukprot:238385_1
MAFEQKTNTNKTDSAMGSKTSIVDRYLAETNKILDKYDKIGQNDPYSPSEIIANFLWLGSAGNARKADELQKMGITHILNLCAAEFGKQYDQKYNFKVCRMDTDDSQDYEILSNEIINKCFEFINQCKSTKNGKIFVHCIAGANRSATITTAYLMYSLKITYLEAIEHIAKKRIWILSNESFKRQLIRYAKKINQLQK